MINFCYFIINLKEFILQRFLRFFLKKANNFFYSTWKKEYTALNS